MGSMPCTRPSVETIPDRIETGTMLVACAICGGNVKIEECNPQHVSAVTARLEDAGAKGEGRHNID